MLRRLCSVSRHVHAGTLPLRGVGDRCSAKALAWPPVAPVCAVPCMHSSTSAPSLTAKPSAHKKRMLVEGIDLSTPKLQIFCGPMASGKTNALLTAVDELRVDGKAVVLIKHQIDKRGGHDRVEARTGLSIRADHCVADLADIPVKAHTVYAIDEAQFFGESLLQFWKRVSGEPSACMLASGLDLDFRREPFGHVLALAAAAMLQPEAVVIRKMLARCTHTTPDNTRCSHPAAYSQRLSSGGTDVILVGSEEYYRPACVHHHHVNPITLGDWPKMGPASKRKA